jgi:hypothetical protein
MGNRTREPDIAELSRDGDELVLTLTALEKAESIHGDIRVPMSSVRDVEVVDDVIHAVHGLKFPGTRWPGRFAIGGIIGPIEQRPSVRPSLSSITTRPEG